MTISLRTVWRQLRKPASSATPLLEAIEPRFSASHAGPSPVFSGELKIVSWNIRLGKLIEPAIAELTGEPALAGADVVLLQEMDETGTDSIARALGHNYVYFPACVHCDTGKNFGNAVLSRWPITAPGKVLLPHLSPRTGENRIANRVVVKVGGNQLLVYSVHTETFNLDRPLRQEQFEALAADIDSQGYERVLAGGDFNTLRARDIRLLDKALEVAGMQRATAGSGATAKLGFLGLNLDHIFTRGFEIIGQGSIRRTRASDHFPLWLKLTAKDNS